MEFKSPLEKIIERAQSGIDTHTEQMTNSLLSPVEQNRHSYLLNVCKMFKSLAIELQNEENVLIRKAKIHDKFVEKIEDHFFTHEGTEVDIESVDLKLVGETAANLIGMHINS